MKKHLFRIIAVLSAAVLLAGCAASRLRLGAAAAGGVYNAFGTAMSAQNSTIEVKQTAGSAANLRLLAGGYLQLAVAQSDMAQDAYDGSGVFAHESTERSFSAVAALYEEAVQVIVRADSGITTLEELQGCTLSVGEEESGTEQNAGQVLAACGLNNRRSARRRAGAAGQDLRHPSALRRWGCRCAAAGCLPGLPRLRYPRRDLRRSG